MEKWLKQLLSKLNTQQQGLQETFKSLEDDALTDEARESLLAEAETQTAEIEKTQADVAKAEKSIKSSQGALAVVGTGHAGLPLAGGDDSASIKSIALASQSTPEIKNFVGANAEARAYAVGLWFAAKHLGSQKSLEKLKNLATKFTQAEVQTGGMIESVDERGGVLVPVEVTNGIDKVAARISVFRQNAKNEPMKTDKKDILTSDGRLKYSFVEELEPGPLSRLKFAKKRLEADKLLGFVAVSNELLEDAIVDLGDMIAGEFGEASADIVDATGFFADGTAKFGGNIGLVHALKTTAAAAPENYSALLTLDIASWDDIDLADMLALTNNVAGRFARAGNLKWYTSSQFYTQVMLRILHGAQITLSDLQNGNANARKFLGYGVEILPEFEAVDFETYGFAKTFVANSIPVVFGNLQKSSYFGNRKEREIARSEHALFDVDGTLYRARERFGVLNTNLGVASATAAERKTGAVAGLFVK